MRFKTLVLIPVIAVLTASAVSLPITQSQTSANEAPQKPSRISFDRSIKISELATKDKSSKSVKTERASRSKKRVRTSDPNVEANKSFARTFMESQYNWGDDQHECLVKLWNRESGWRHTADNPSSSAYGIPQALPGKKMASAGEDWRTNPQTQIKWGLKYIKGRYKTPCGALGHSNKHNWY
jgi:hypothetical protein